MALMDVRHAGWAVFSLVWFTGWVFEHCRRVRRTGREEITLAWCLAIFGAPAFFLAGTVIAILGNTSL